MGVSRRGFLRVGGLVLASAATSSLAAPALAAPALVGLKEANIRSLSFDCTNTGEQLNRVDYWVEGQYVPDALAEIDEALRDFRTGEVHPIEPRLLDLLYQLGRALDTNGQFALTSGYRSPETNAMLHQYDSGVAVNSLHMRGQAADISVPGRPLQQVHEAALALRVGGVGYYPNPIDEFIHVDVGRVRRWEG
jgi:uncharacterized protein YcbK (DUF882 family)